MCPFELRFSVDVCPVAGLLSYSSSVFSFLSNLHTVLHSGCINLHSHQQCKKFCFSPPPLQHLLYCIFCWWIFWSAVCISLIINYVEHLSMCLMAICYVFGETSIHVFCPFLFGLFFWYWAPWDVFIFWSLILSRGRYCCWNLASVHWHRVETWRQSSDWSKGRYSRQMVSRLCPTLEGLLRSLMLFKEQGMISLWTFFWFFGDEVIKESASSASGFNCTGVSCMLGGSLELTSSTWWGFQNLQNSLKDMAQNIIYSPWGRTKGPWLCLLAKVLLFCLAWQFSFLSEFSHFSD